MQYGANFEVHPGWSSFIYRCYSWKSDRFSKKWTIARTSITWYVVDIYNSWNFDTIKRECFRKKSESQEVSKKMNISQNLSDLKSTLRLTEIETLKSVQDENEPFWLLNPTT